MGRFTSSATRRTNCDRGQAPAAQPQPADMNERIAQLKQLGELLSAGVLTQAEFEQQKARILNG